MAESSEPCSAQWAIDLFTYDPKYEQSVINVYFAEACTTATAVGSVCLRNLMTRKPMFTGFHHHIIAAVVGFGIGRFISLQNQHAAAKRDAIYVDYIRLHPERFPEPAKKKYAEVFEPWPVIR